MAKVKMMLTFTADLDINPGGSKFFYVQDWDRWVRLQLTTSPEAVVYAAGVEVTSLEVVSND